MNFRVNFRVNFSTEIDFFVRWLNTTKSPKTAQESQKQKKPQVNAISSSGADIYNGFETREKKL